MKPVKKTLSALLAALMLFTSLNAGFAALAAATDKYQILADALSAEAVQNAVWSTPVKTGSDEEGESEYRVTMEDPTGEIEAAAEAFWDLAYNDVAPKYAKPGTLDREFHLNGVKEEIRTTLENEYGMPSELTNAALTAFTAGQDGDAMSNEESNPTTPNKRYYVFEVTRGDLGSQLLEYDSVEDLPDTISTGVEYRWFHDAESIQTTLGWWAKYRRHIYLALETENGKTERALTEPSSEVPDALKAYGAHFTEKLLATDLEQLTGDELQAMYDEAYAKVQALMTLGLWGNDEIMTHFFGAESKDTVEDFIDRVKTKIDITYASECVTEIKALMDANPQPDVLSDETLQELNTRLPQLISEETGLLKYTSAAQAAALEAAGLTMEQIRAYISDLQTEIDFRALTGYKADVDAIIAGVPDIGAADDAALQSALAQAKGKFALIASLQLSPAFARVFPEGTGYVETFIHNVTVEVQARQLETEALEFDAYFAVHMAADLAAVPTDELIDSYRTPDRAKFDNEVNQFEPEALDRIYGAGWYASVQAYIASIDAVLNARVEAQIDEAYNGYYDAGEEINIFNFRSVSNAIGGVETRIIETLGGLSAEYQAKYDTFSAIMEEYNTFVESKGFSNWEKTDVGYPVRKAMSDDVARTADETYAVTADKLNEAITSLDGLMHNTEFSALLGLDTAVSELIKAAVADNLYTDATVNTLVTTIYGGLTDTINNLDLGSLGGLLNLVGGIGQLLEDLGVAYYPKDVAKYMHSELYPEATQAMQNAGKDWSAYDSTVTWHVTDQESFVNAASYALCGLQNVLRPLLTDQPYSKKVSWLSIEVKISSASIYNNDLLPLLELIGCEGLMPAEEYNDGQWSQDLLPPLLTPLLNLVNRFADAPVSTLLDLLPKLGYLMEFDMLTEHLKGINISVTAMGMDILQSALGSSNLYGILSSLLPDNIDLAILGDINALLDLVIDLVAGDTPLLLPEIDQAYLASLGDLSEAESGRIGGKRVQYTSDQPAALVALLRYVLNMAGDADFMNALLAVVSELTGSEINLSEDIMTVITDLGDDPDNVICALTELFVPQRYASKEIDYRYTDTAGTPIREVAYSENWTQEQAQYIVDNLPEFADNMVQILVGCEAESLGAFIRNSIANEFYTNASINSLVILIRDALGGIGIDLAPVLGLVDVDLSSWDAVTEDTDWGVVTGDKDTFAKGLSNALAPLAPVLATVLLNQELTVLDTIHANGYEGYRNGIIPLLENLGCNPDDILTQEEYAAKVAEDPANALNAILMPLLNLVDEIYNNPVEKIVEILPNLIYFLDCNGLQTCVENAAQAVFVLLDTIRPAYNIRFDLNLNLQQMVIDLLSNLEVNGQKLGLQIPALTNLKSLLVGTVMPYDSKSGTTAYRIETANKADFVTVLLRSVVEILFYEDNIEAVTGLIASQTGMDDTTRENLFQILNTFAKLYQEDNGVDKILNAAYVIFQKTHETTDSAVTEIKDFNERWSAVFDMLYNSEDENLVNLTKWADEVLDFLTFGLINGGGIGTNGLIDFFQRLAAFFQGKVTDVSIDRTSASLLVGEQTTLSLSFKPITVKNKNATWESSRPSVATVENGVVTAVGVGDTEITATTEDGGFTVSCVVRVRANKAALNEAIALVESANLEGDNLAAVSDVLAKAKAVAEEELASQPSVDAARQALLDVFYALDLGTPVTSVVLTQNGAPVGDVVYQKVSWTKKWNSTPVTLGVQINGGALGLDDVKRVSWEYADWSVNKPEADIEANGMEAVIRAKNSVVGAHSCWIQVTVEDAYGNTVTSNPVKVRFYNYDWQK